MSTRQVNEYPVERALDAEDRVRALRVDFVTDVADLAGEWREVGHVEIGSGRCAVADPYCMHSNPGYYSVELGAPNGRHPVEVFYWEDDMLRIRVLFDGSLERPQWGVE